MCWASKCRSIIVRKHDSALMCTLKVPNVHVCSLCKIVDVDTFARIKSLPRCAAAWIIPFHALSCTKAGIADCGIRATFSSVVFLFVA